MQITIDTNNLSDLDKSVLALLAGGAAPAAAPAAKATPAPAKKAAAAPKKEEPVEEPEADEPDADEEQGSDEPTIDDAKEKASALVSNGEAAKVKAALTAVGAKKVSEIPANKVAAFLAELD